jgi:hypothetical protein
MSTRFEDANLAQLRIQPLDFIELLGEALLVQPSRDRGMLSVVGDGKVLIATRVCRLHHLAQTALAVGFLGVYMEVPTNVGKRDELRQCSSIRRLDLAAVFSQLGLDIRQADRAEDFFLAAPPNPPAVAKDSVFVDFQPARLSKLANGYVVRF